jgi:PilZ domain-containing protein
MAERRVDRRMRTLKGARILFNTRGSVLDCTLRNLSDTGACLVVATTVGIPEQFELLLESDRTVRPCRVAWQKDKQIGVQFVGPAVPFTRSS